MSRQKIRHDEEIMKIMFEDDSDNGIDSDQSDLSSDEEDGRDPTWQPPCEEEDVQLATGSSPAARDTQERATDEDSVDHEVAEPDRTEPSLQRVARTYARKRKSPSTEPNSSASFATSQADPAVNSSVSDGRSQTTPSQSNSGIAAKTKVPRDNPKSKPVKARRRIWRANVDNPLAESVPPFTGDGRVLLNLSNESDPVDFFEGLLSDEILAMVVRESNAYALSKKGYELNLTSAELRIYVGCLLIMSYVRYPRIENYWSNSLRLPQIADYISSKRFKKIRECLHFTTQQSSPDGDKYYKIRPFLEMLRNSFKAAVADEEYSSIDEMMVAFKGRSSLKQYMASKPTKWGFKIWVRAGVSGYVYDFEPYQGSGANRNPPAYGLGGDVVVKLTRGLENTNAKVYFDNFFTSVSLVEALAKEKIYSVGTLRANRLGDAAPKLITEVEMKKKKRGTSSFATSAEGVTVLRWKDNNLVNVCSSFAGYAPTDSVQRWCSTAKSKVAVERPYAVKEYNKCMGGVDLMDSLTSLYKNDFRNKRWYMRLFHHFLDVAVVNAWILYRKTCPVGTLDLLHFKASVAVAMTNKGMVRMRTSPGRPSKIGFVKKRTVIAVPNEIRLDGLSGHWPGKSDKNNASRCQDKNCTSKTRFICKKCKVALCPECFENFHSVR